jgi:hypothetical protein
LKDRNDGGLGSNFVVAGVRFFVFVVQDLLEELGDGAFASGGVT